MNNHLLGLFITYLIPLFFKKDSKLFVLIINLVGLGLGINIFLNLYNAEVLIINIMKNIEFLFDPVSLILFLLFIVISFFWAIFHILINKKSNQFINIHVFTLLGLLTILSNNLYTLSLGWMGLIAYFSYRLIQDKNNQALAYFYFEWISFSVIFISIFFICSHFNNFSFNKITEDLTQLSPQKIYYPIIFLISSALINPLKVFFINNIYSKNNNFFIDFYFNNIITIFFVSLVLFRFFPFIAQDEIAMLIMRLYGIIISFIFSILLIKTNKIVEIITFLPLFFWGLFSLCLGCNGMYPAIYFLIVFIFSFILYYFSFFLEKTRESSLNMLDQMSAKSFFVILGLFYSSLSLIGGPLTPGHLSITRLLWIFYRYDYFYFIIAITLFSINIVNIFRLTFLISLNRKSELKMGQGKGLNILISFFIILLFLVSFLGIPSVFTKNWNMILLKFLQGNHFVLIKDVESYNTILFTYPLLVIIILFFFYFQIIKGSFSKRVQAKLERYLLIIQKGHYSFLLFFKKITLIVGGGCLFLLKIIKSTYDFLFVHITSKILLHSLFFIRSLASIFKQNDILTIYMQIFLGILVMLFLLLKSVGIF